MREFARGAPQQPEKKILEQGVAFKTEPLRLVFIRVRLEANQVRDLGKNPGRRMREWDGQKDAQPGVFAERDTPRASVALLVKRKHDGAVRCRRVDISCTLAQVLCE